MMTPSRQLLLFRIINIAGLVALLGVLTGLLDLQFVVGEQPCPQFLFQRAGLIGMAAGLMMNVLWGLCPAHYAVSILAAFAGGASSTRHTLLHIAGPGDPGYGPVVAGFHLYTWTFVIFTVGAVGCAVLLLFSNQFSFGDTGVLHQRGALRAVCLAFFVWISVYLVIITVSILPECGLGLCPGDPLPTSGVSRLFGLLCLLGIVLGSFAAGYVLNRRLSTRDDADSTSGS
jgi:disulfide bond formation protein DsbB